MTDNEIIEALECCTQQAGCSGCPFVISNEMKYRGGYACSEALRKNALDLINRQKAEIERLKEVIVNMTNEQISFGFKAKTMLVYAKTEAIKDFAVRLKSRFMYDRVINNAIDNLVKEMAGERE